MMTDSSHPGRTAARLSSAEVVYLGAWHVAFFHTSWGQSSPSPWQRIVGVLQLIGSCGFDVAASYAAQLRTPHASSRAAVHADKRKEAEEDSARDVLQSVYAVWRRGGVAANVPRSVAHSGEASVSSPQHSHSWPQLFLLSSAVYALSHRHPPRVDDAMRHLLHSHTTASSEAATLPNAPPPIESVAPHPSDAVARSDWNWWMSLAHPILTTAGVHGDASTDRGVEDGVSAAQNSLIFELQLPFASTPSRSSTLPRARRAHAVRDAFYTARLYAALVLAGNTESPITAVATLLIAYLMQDDSAVQRLLHVEADSDSAAEPTHDTCDESARDERTVRLLRRARIRGVVGG